MRPPLPPAEILEELARYRMPFGKYEGQLLLRLPEAYLAWFARKGMPQGKLGMLLESALVVRQNGLEPLLEPIVRRAEGLPDPTEEASPPGTPSRRQS